MLTIKRINRKFLLHTALVCLFVHAYVNTSYSQQNIDKQEFERLIHESDSLRQGHVLGPSMVMLKKAREMAKENHWEREYLIASIKLAELYRSTQVDHKLGLKILLELEKTINYPELHVRKLDRLGAIYREMGSDYDVLFRQFVDSTMKMAKEYKFDNVLASVSNEWGYQLFKESKHKEALPYFYQAADIYWELNDTANYINVMANAVETYVCAQDSAGAMKYIDTLTKIVANTQFPVKHKLYNIVADAIVTFQKDSMQWYKWVLEGEKVHIDILRNNHADELQKNRVEMETEKYRQSAILKDNKLKEAIKRRRNLIIFIASMALLLVLLALVLLRERKLKKTLSRTVGELNLSNDRYQSLLMELSHRVKNNMQMVSGILELQLSKTDNVDYKNALKLATDRIKAVSISHQDLYIRENYEHLYIKDYMKSIAANLQVDDSVDIEINIPEDYKLSIEPAQTLGLTFNELLTNSLKHAWPDGHSVSPKVVVNLKQGTDETTLIFKDNGIGIDPKQIDATSIGMLLIRGFVERQFKGTIQFKSNNGTEVIIKFPNNAI